MSDDDFWAKTQNPGEAEQPCDTSSPSNLEALETCGNLLSRPGRIQRPWPEDFSDASKPLRPSPPTAAESLLLDVYLVEGTMPKGKHLRGVSDAEQRQYEHILEAAAKSGRYGSRAKEVAARTVLKQHKRHAHKRGQ